MLTCSACYIVKNEAHTLPRSIASLKDVCKEIIVVDTGSTDNTMQVAEQAGAQVLQFAWINDFSAARNFALSHATGDIVIFIDADEYFEPALTPAHIKLLQKCVDAGEFVFGVRMVNLAENGNNSELFLVRMFCNNMGIKYKNAVHEMVDKWERQCFLPDAFTLIHTGYMGDTTAKTLRNLELLRAQLDPETDTSENVVMYFYIAREANQIKEHAEAAKYINKFFESVREQQLNFPIHLMIAVHRMRLKLALLDATWAYSGQDRREFVQEYLDAFPTHPMPWLLKGIYEFEYTGDYRAADSAFQRMERLEEVYDERQFPGDFVSTQNDRGIVWKAQAAIAAQRGDAETAFDYYIQLLQRGPDQITLNYLLRSIEGQPAGDCAALLQSLLDLKKPEMLEQLMNILVYYPAHRDLYMYCAKLHLQQTKAYSDLTALVSLLLGQPAHALKVAQGMDPGEHMRDALLCTALFCGGDASLADGLPLQEPVRGLVQAYFAHTPLGPQDPETWKLLCVICRQMLFIGNEAATERFWQLFAGQPFMRYLLESSYAHVGGHHAWVLDCFDLDTGRFNALQAAYCYLRLARSHVELQQYGEALGYYQAALERNGNLAVMARDLHVILSMSLEYGLQAQGLINRFAQHQPEALDIDENENRVFIAVRSMFVAPELHQLVIAL